MIEHTNIERENMNINKVINKITNKDNNLILNKTTRKRITNFILLMGKF